MNFCFRFRLPHPLRIVLAGWGFLWLSLTGAPHALQAQDFLTAKSLSGRTAKRFEEMRADIGRDNLAAALDKANALLAQEPRLIDAWLIRAGIHHDLGNLPAAEQDYEHALQLAPEFDPLAWYRLALTEKKLNKFDEAADHLLAFLATDGGRPATRQRAQTYLADMRFAAQAMRNPVPFDPFPLGDSINTPRQEYLPTLTADGASLIYTVNDGRQEDFYYSQRLPDGSGWTQGQPMTGVNTSQNEGAQTISADGRMLVFTACNRADGQGSCDLYWSRQEGAAWTQARNLGPGVNTSAWDSQPSLSADGQALYFSSERLGGKGGRDLWAAYRLETGRWGAPVNLGDSLNTPGDEESPFIHADGQTLYFMSNGHPGMGETDLFVSRRGPDGQWGRPVNLGYPINTTGHEGALFVDLAGSTAYFTTDRANLTPGESRNRTNLDIYAFTLPTHLRPQACTYVRGVVRHAATDALLANASVEIYEDGAQQARARVHTDASGTFLLVLPTGQDYALSVRREGFVFYSDRFELRAVKGLSEPYELEVRLLPLLPSAGEQPPVVLKNVLFATGSAELLPASAAELGRLHELLLANPQLRIRIEGHTDDVGELADNLQLSENRAQAVYQWLVERGIAPARLSYRGYGETQPLADNSTPAGRALNRRTAFVVVAD